MLRAFLLSGLLFACAGCASVEPLPQPYAPPALLPSAIAERFCYDAPPVNATLSLKEEAQSYRIYSGSLRPELDVFDDDSPVTFEYYEQLTQPAAPVVLVLPILNGQKNIVRPFAEHFAKNGYATVIVDTVQRKTLLEDLIRPEDAILQTVLRHRRVLDWVDTLENIDSDRIAVFGASLGGFNALFLSAADARIRAAALALVAGDLPYVLTHSTERRIEEAVAKARAELGVDEDGLQAYLSERIDTDPMTLAPYIDASRTLMVLAKFDNAVPYDKQVELREAMGHPEAIYLPTGHRSAAAYLFYLRERVLKFFDRKLGQQPGEVVSVAERAGSCATDRLASP